jgi:hypothetical protein
LIKNVLGVTELTGLNGLFHLKKFEIALTKWKLGRDSEGEGGSGSVVESNCVGQVDAAIIVDDAGGGIEGRRCYC